MIPPILLRGPLLLASALLLASCRGKPKSVIVDMVPLADGLKFLGVAIVLAMIIKGIFGLWEKR